MKPVDVVFKKAEVLNFDGRTGLVEFRVIVNDGKDKAIQRSQIVEDCTALANSIFQEVRKKIKTLHSTLNLDDDPLASIVMVRIAGDEEVIIERLAKFFASVKEKIRNAKMKRLSYLDMERQIKGLSTDLT